MFHYWEDQALDQRESVTLPYRCGGHTACIIIISLSQVVLLPDIFLPYAGEVTLFV